MFLSKRLILRGAVLAGAALATPQAHAQTLDDAFVREHYAKREVRIAMRDGVTLFTAIYSPRDTSRTWPILITRTPYGVAPYGPDMYKVPLGPNMGFTTDGFIFVYQDVRGRFMSEGRFVNVTPYIDHKHGPRDVDESSDTYDTIDWLIKNVPHNNGRVGQVGISYPGFYTAAGVIDAHPALKAASPQAPVADWFHGDDFHHNGVMWLPHFAGFIAGFGKPRPGPTMQAPAPFKFPTPDGYAFYLETVGPVRNLDSVMFHDSVEFWHQFMSHPNYDTFWKGMNILDHFKGIGPSPAIMTVGGWFDAENLNGALHVYQAIAQESPRADNRLVMGPWFHGGWERSSGDSLGNARFGSRTSEYFRDSLELPFFDCHLKDMCTAKLAKATVFETGTNVWRQYDRWPPASAVRRSVYLRANGRLSLDVPSRDAKYDEYVSDPAHPVPYVPYIAQGMQRPYMTDDQRFAEERPDVLAFRTEAFTQPLTVAGPIKVSLWVSTTGTDSDWIVKVIDVFPDDAPDFTPNPAGFHAGGYEMLVRGDAMAGRFRAGFEKPEPFTANIPAKVEFTMNDVNHTWLPGHRMMIQVQSTWFPLAARNPQTFLANPYLAVESDFRKATQRVYHTPEMPSHVELLILPR